MKKLNTISSTEAIEKKIDNISTFLLRYETRKWRHLGKSAASVCCQVEVLVPDMFWNFCLVKNYKIANNSVIAEAREK